jgi:hypothetical protein
MMDDWLNFRLLNPDGSVKTKTVHTKFIPAESLKSKKRSGRPAKKKLDSAAPGFCDDEVKSIVKSEKKEFVKEKKAKKKLRIARRDGGTCLRIMKALLWKWCAISCLVVETITTQRRNLKEDCKHLDLRDLFLAQP